ncbi:MAG: exodeoxyribonuclease III [Deltaproteobacteria bacterium]|nr:exodeoxyribonuclease III [Deltaproteobacteria bacterium]
MGTFRVATYNVNSIRSRLHIVIPWLQEQRPDVFCMQETKVGDEQFPQADFRAAGYHVTFRGAKQYNGVAIASKAPPTAVRYGLADGGPPDEDRLIAGVFDGITVVNTYVPQGREKDSDQFTYKLAWYRRLKRFFAAHYSPDQPLLWCGDLNVAPEAIDVHDPKRLLGHVCFTPEVWEAFADLRAWGLEDLFRRHHPAEPDRYTFFDYRVPQAAKRGLGWRIDHILATPSLAARSLRCEIDMHPRLAEKPSDHTILVTDFTTP